MPHPQAALLRRSSMSQLVRNSTTKGTSQLVRCASQQPSISIDKPIALITEPIRICVSGLSHERVTLLLSVTEPYATFCSIGHFFTDLNGQVLVPDSISYGGTYTGRDGMGLFWSLRERAAKPRGMRLLRREAARPLMFSLSALPGHVTWHQIVGQGYLPEELCSIELQRTYLSETVEQHTVRFGRIRASLFCPKGQQSPAPAILDVFGSNGGMMEHRAALLAERGFCVLALAYFNYEDLPKQLNSIDLDYFEEAVDYLLNSDYSVGSSVGLVGTSSGADIVAMLSIVLRDKIACTVWVNGTHCHVTSPFKRHGQLLPNYIEPRFDLATMSHTPPGLDMRQCYHPDCSWELLLPLEQATCEFLLITSLDDQGVPPQAAQRLTDRLHRFNRNNFTHLAYPGAGHLLEPPYGPCAPLLYHGLFKYHFYYGGQPESHHRAQMDSWPKIVDFFHKCLDKHRICPAKL